MSIPRKTDSKSLRFLTAEIRKGLLAAACFVALALCPSCGNSKPSIEFTKVPVASRGGPEKLDLIQGSVTGSKPGQHIILFAFSEIWWCQPYVTSPLTDIRPDSTWQNQTHLGTKYAAVLVEAGYRPPETMDELPPVGGPVAAVAIVDGTPPDPASNEQPLAPAKTIQFGGYEWNVRGGKIDNLGSMIARDDSNAWTDEKGFLHLRISLISGTWCGVEIALNRSLGYGTYKFTVRDTSRLEPAAYFAMLTYDDRVSGQQHREMDLEISHFGDPAKDNLQFVVQPYDLPINMSTARVPAGTLTGFLNWKAALAEFKVVRGSADDPKAKVIGEHQFTSGIPTPGGEVIHLCLFPFPNPNIPVERENEIVLEKFEFLP